MPHPRLRHLMGLQDIVGAAGSEPIGNPHLAAMADRGARGLLLGFGPTSVAGAASATFSAQPTLHVRVSRAIVPSYAAPGFSVNDLRVGRASQLLSPNAIPATAIAENAVDAGIRADTANLGQLISLAVTNKNVGALTFEAMVIGVAYDG